MNKVQIFCEWAANVLKENEGEYFTKNQLVQKVVSKHEDQIKNDYTGGKSISSFDGVCTIVDGRLQPSELKKFEVVPTDSQKRPLDSLKGIKVAYWVYNPKPEVCDNPKDIVAIIEMLQDEKQKNKYGKNGDDLIGAAIVVLKQIEFK